MRGQRVMLDSDLAALYGVETRALNQAVKRNVARFPEDFVFRLSREEASGLRRLRSQFVILKRGEHLKYGPLAFTRVACDTPDPPAAWGPDDEEAVLEQLGDEVEPAGGLGLRHGKSAPVGRSRQPHRRRTT